LSAAFFKERTGKKTGPLKNHHYPFHISAKRKLIELQKGKEASQPHNAAGKNISTFQNMEGKTKPQQNPESPGTRVIGITRESEQATNIGDSIIKIHLTLQQHPTIQG